MVAPVTMAPTRGIVAPARDEYGGTFTGEGAVVPTGSVEYRQEV